MQNKVLNIFSANTYNIKEIETDTLYKLEFSFNDFVKDNYSDIVQIFDEISPRDKLTIYISMDGLEPIIIRIKNDCNDLEERLRREFLSVIEPDSVFSVIFSIDKKIINNKLSFYSFKKFKSFLFEMDMVNRLQYFNNIISKYKYINFVIFDDLLEEKIILKTTTICLTSNHNEDNIAEFNLQITRHSVLEKQRSVCNVVNNPASILVPDDFFIKERTFYNKEIEEYFLHTSFSLLLAFIFDFTEFYGNKIKYKINGYKPLDGCIDFNVTEIFNIGEFFKIYMWIYEAGNVVDKIGLARNILTLNIVNRNSENTSEFFISDNTFSSISSGYNIYLKENVNEYIEIKNKVSEFMINQSLEATKIIKDFVNSLKSTNYLYITVFMTFIVFNVLNPDSNLIFTKEVIYISFAVLAVSFLYLILNTLLINSDKKRFIDQYNRLKRMYSDLLSEDDISAIFLENEEKQDITYIENKTKLYVIIWISELLVLLLLIIVIAHMNSVIDISESLINLFRKYNFFEH